VVSFLFIILSAPFSNATSVQRFADFKLYSKQGHFPDIYCDRYTNLTLDYTENAASLENKLGGLCEIKINPDQRQYKITKVTNSCGSSIYNGHRMVGKRLSSGGIARAVEFITISDHRTRTCRDMVPANIVVQEIRGKNKTTLYSPAQYSPANNH